LDSALGVSGGVLAPALAKVKWARKRLDELSAAISSSEFAKTHVTFQQTFESLINRIDVTIADTPRQTLSGV